MTLIADDLEAPTRPHLAIDPRIVRRRLEVRREQARRRLRFLLAVGGLVVVVAAGLGAVHTPLVRVRHVRITAPPTLADGAVRRAAHLDGSALMVGVDVGADARRLEALPLVATAAVVRQWPATVQVTVTARTAVAVALAAGHTLVLDRTGRVLDAPGSPPAGLPVLTTTVGAVPVGAWLPGTVGPGRAALTASDPAHAAAASSVPGDPVAAELALATALTSTPALVPALGTGVPLPLADGPAQGLVATVGATRVVFGDPTALPSKAAALAALLAHGPLTGMAQVDLRVPDRPVAIPGPHQG